MPTPSEREKRERESKLLEPPDLAGDDPVTARDFETWRADLLHHLGLLEKLRDQSIDAANDARRAAEDMGQSLEEAGNLCRMILAVAMGHPIAPEPGPPEA